MSAAAKLSAQLARLSIFVAALVSGNDVFKEAQAATVTLSDRPSGYVGEPRNWTEFLSCWAKERATHYLELKKGNPVLPNYSAIGMFSGAPDDRAAAQLLEISRFERSLGIALPKSYKDFLIAYQPRVLQAQSGPGGQVTIGMYAPSQVGRVSAVAPALLQGARKYPIESDDREYFVYGKEQDVMAGRTKNLADAIVVGKYGSAMFEIIALYPQVTTVDGEMEATMGFHAGEFRASSFAELMRQLSVLETRPVSHVPPYSQGELRGTCAEKLPIANPWWK
jgi:hypothetical protein